MKYKAARNKIADPIAAPCKKAMYNSLIDAQESIEYLRENKTGRNLSAYKCDVCGFWHLTKLQK